MGVEATGGTALDTVGDTGKGRRILTLCFVVMAAAVYEINMTNAAVILPHMQGAFSATKDQIAWVVTAFIVGMLMGFAWSGWCSNQFGRRAFFLACLGAYIAASYMCGAAGSLEEEVVWRFAQGMLGAPMMPISHAIVLDSFPREKMAVGNAIWAIGIMVGPVLGPVVGGYIADSAVWRWVFYFNLPVGIPIFLGCLAFIPRAPREPARHFDWFGCLSLTLAIGAFQLAINRGERLDWFASTEVIVEATIAVVSAYLFVVHITTTRHPFVRVEMFRDRNLSLGLLIALVWGFLLHGVLVLISIMMQELRGYPVIILGEVLAPRGIGVMAGSIVAIQAARFFDPRYTMTGAVLLIAGSSWIMAQWTLDVTPWEVAWSGALQGFGTGIGFVTLASKTFSTLEDRYRTEALTFYNLTTFVGIGTGIAFAVSLVTRNTSGFHALLAEAVSPHNKLLRFFDLPDAWDPASEAGRAALDAVIVQQAAMISYLNYFFLITVIAVATVPLIFLFKGGRMFGARTGH